MLLKKILWASVIFGIFPLLFGSMIFFEASQPHEQDMRLFSLLIIAPWPVCVVLLRRAINKEKQAFFDGINQIGGATYQYYAEGWGIAINPSQRKILVTNGKNLQIYPFEKIRGWAISDQKGGLVFGGGLAGGLANTGRIIDNARNTGLRIDVMDIDHSTWMISMGDQRVRERWFEILRQSVNEGIVA